MDVSANLPKAQKPLKARKGATLEELDDGGKATYMPPMRTLEEIFEEDETHAPYYAEVVDRDKDVIVSRGGKVMQRNVVIDDWNEAHLDGQLLENIRRSNWTRPRKIQSALIPLFLTVSSDLKGHAETGTGKTAAFLIPLINGLIPKVRSQKQKRMSKPWPIAIVIEPTRELCMQVHEQGRKLADGTGVSVGKTYGRTNFHGGMLELQRYGSDILITTVGRLKHFIKNNLIDVTRLEYMILDEADRLLVPDIFYPRKLRRIQNGDGSTNGDLGYEPEFLDEIKEIMGFLPPKDTRRNFLFSATFPIAVEELSSIVLRDDCLMVSNNDLVSVNRLVTQEFFEVTDQATKNYLLIDILTRNFDEAEAENQRRAEQGIEVEVNPKQVMVFVQTKRDSDRVAGYLCAQGIAATSVNGDRRQELREKSLRDFHNCREMVLVATDVMARGIDVKDLDHIINFDMPPEDVTYVHRIGRTGRLKPGLATSFFDHRRKEDLNLAPGLIKLLEKDGHDVPDYIAKYRDAPVVTTRPESAPIIKHVFSGVQYASTQDGTIQNGSIQNGSIQNGSVHNGSIYNRGVLNGADLLRDAMSIH